MKKRRGRLVVMAVLLTACGAVPGPYNPTSAGVPIPIAPTPAPARTATATPASFYASPKPTLSPTVTPSSLFAPVTESEWQDGPADAAVTIVEYADFQCAYCGTLAGVLAQIRKEYSQDFHLVFRHFPLQVDDKAMLAAQAAEAAGAQGEFWAMHDLLYARQSDWTKLSPGEFRARLDAYAAEIGLDAKEFSASLDGEKYLARVQAAYDTAITIPLPGAPFLLFNGAPYQGPTNHWALAALIRLEKLKARQFVAPQEVIDPFRKYSATLHTARGEVTLELFTDQAPLTVNNFVFLAQSKWYDGNTFYRVIPGVLAETGDPTDTGLGGPGYYLPDEISPDLRFDAAGWVGMESAGPNTNGSRFFISLAALPERNGRYTLFGKVVSGMDVLARLTPRDPDANPEAAPGDKLNAVTIEEK